MTTATTAGMTIAMTIGTTIATTIATTAPANPFLGSFNIVRPPNQRPDFLHLGAPNPAAGIHAGRKFRRILVHPAKDRHDN
jgi:hypothetical protein